MDCQFIKEIIWKNLNKTLSISVLSISHTVYIFFQNFYHEFSIVRYGKQRSFKYFCTAHTCIDICRTYLSAQIFCLERVSLSVFYKVSFALAKLEML